MITTMRGESVSLKDRMIASGRYKQISHDEYMQLQREQSRRLAQQEAASYKPDYARIGIKEDEAGLTWEAVKPGISDGMKAVQAVRPAYERGFGMIFIYGAWGQAKTLIGKILTATAFRAGKRTAYANMSSVLDDIRLAYDEKENKMTELLRRMDWWVEREVLFIDELDKTSQTEWAQDRLFQLMDRRYQMAVREEALTVIASNKSENELDGYLKSRIHDNRIGQVVFLNGNDGRKVMPEGYKF